MDKKLLQKNNSVKLIGNPKNKGGVLSFTIEGIHPHDIATILDEDWCSNKSRPSLLSNTT